MRSLWTSGGSLSLSTAKLFQNDFDWNRLSAFTLSDRFEKQSFSLWIRLERILLGKEHRNRRSLREFNVRQLDMPIDHRTRGYSHPAILLDGDVVMAVAALIRNPLDEIRGGKSDEQDD